MCRAPTLAHGAGVLEDYLNCPGGQGSPHSVSRSCDELKLPFCDTCWKNFGWFSFFPGCGGHSLVPWLFTGLEPSQHSSGAANAATLPNDIVSANMSAAINNEMRLRI